MARKKSVEELQAKADKLQEQLKQARAEARKAKQLEDAKRKKAEEAERTKEALKLIDVSKTVYITVKTAKDETESITVYEYLKKNCADA